MTNLKNYNEYWVDFETKEFIGDFEGMYRNVEDPWHHGEALAPHYGKLINVLKDFTDNFKSIIDLGCGKGAFTSRLALAFPRLKIRGIDVSETAIAAANARKNANQSLNSLSFSQGSYLETPNLLEGIKNVEGPKLFLMCDILWYLLHDLNGFWQSTENILSQKSLNALVISQTFYPKGRQRYLAEFCNDPESLAAQLKNRGFSVSVYPYTATDEGSYRANFYISI